VQIPQILLTASPKLAVMQGLRPMTLNELKRITYFWALLIAIPTPGLVWWFRLDDPFIRFLYPVFALLCGLWMWRLWARADVVRVEKETITGVGLFFGLKFAFNLFLPTLAPIGPK
jgi:hypothetical protein